SVENSMITQGPCLSRFRDRQPTSDLANCRSVLVEFIEEAHLTVPIAAVELLTYPGHFVVELTTRGVPQSTERATY
ncbi:hypothetical protein ACWFRK_42540, partial [Streptomyces sp. NPDC055157]